MEVVFKEIKELFIVLVVVVGFVELIPSSSLSSDTVDTYSALAVASLGEQLLKDRHSDLPNILFVDEAHVDQEFS